MPDQLKSESTQFVGLDRIPFQSKSGHVHISERLAKRLKQGDTFWILPSTGNTDWNQIPRRAGGYLSGLNVIY
jgi:hypothetical protein